MAEAAERATKTPEAKIGWRQLFGILAIIMTSHAVAFAVWFDVSKASWEPLLVVTGILFLCALGLGQKLLYQGKQPFKASAVMGAWFFLSLYVFYLGVALRVHRPVFAFPFAPFDPIEALLGGAIYGLVFGMPVALAFLLIDGAKILWNKLMGKKQVAATSWSTTKSLTTAVLALVVSSTVFYVAYVWQQWYIPAKATVAAIEQRYPEQLKKLADYAYDYEHVSEKDRPDSEKIQRLFGDAAIVEASIDDSDGMNQIPIRPGHSLLLGTSCWFPRAPSTGKPVVNLYQGGGYQYIKYSNVALDRNGKQRAYTIVVDLLRMDENDE
jgi:hypothetical protein